MQQKWLLIQIAHDSYDEDGADTEAGEEACDVEAGTG